MTPRLLIQNTLIRAAQEGRFYAVSYDPDTHLAQDLDPATAAVVAPQSAMANEILSTFETDPRNGRDLVRHRTRWAFDLLVNFPCEVTAEFFEQELCRNPPRIARDAAHGIPQILLFLRQTSVIHPVAQQSSAGTVIKFAFECFLDRI